MADAQSFDGFYRATARRVQRYAFVMTGNLESAQDITQEAYVRAWRRWSTVSRYEHPEAWVRLVVARLATDWWRRLTVRRRHEAADRGPEPMPAPSEWTVLLVDALRRIPARQRQAICLHYLLDLSVGDIAREIGVPEGTVKSWLHRARSTLAASFAPAHPTLQEGNGVR